MEAEWPTRGAAVDAAEPSASRFAGVRKGKRECEARACEWEAQLTEDGAGARGSHHARTKYRCGKTGISCAAGDRNKVCRWVMTAADARMRLHRHARAGLPALS